MTSGSIASPRTAAKELSKLLALPPTEPKSNKACPVRGRLIRRYSTTDDEKKVLQHVATTSTQVSAAASETTTSVESISVRSMTSERTTSVDAIDFHSLATSEGTANSYLTSEGTASTTLAFGSGSSAVRALSLLASARRDNDTSAVSIPMAPSEASSNVAVSTYPSDDVIMVADLTKELDLRVVHTQYGTLSKPTEKNVLLMAEPPFTPDAIYKVIRKLQNSDGEAPSAEILVVLLMLSPVSSPDIDLNEISSIFSIHNVDIVIHKPECLRDLSTTIPAIITELQQNREEQQIELDMTIWWSNMPCKLSGFPSLNPTLSSRHTVGAMVGHKKLTKLLGKGAYGHVYEAVDTRNGQYVALKAIPKTKLTNFESVRKVWLEWNFLNSCRHPNIASFLGKAHSNEYLYILMEHAGSHHLERAIVLDGGRLQAIRAKHILAQLVSALAHMHSLGVAHRDIKPQNIMLSGTSEHMGHAKLVDFGLAVETDTVCRSSAGTMPFAAPEVLGHPVAYWADAADIWSLGITLLEMLCGINVVPNMLGWPSHQGPKNDRLKAKAHLVETFGCTKACVLPYIEQRSGTSVTESLKELLLGTLNIDPLERWTVSNLQDAQWVHGPSTVTGSSIGNTACGTVACSSGSENADEQQLTH